MGIIKQGILGGFKGKVGSVVGTSWKGRAVMKAMPLSVANPKTALQVAQRTKLSQIVALAKPLLGGSIALLENPFAGNISGYNRFVSRNVKDAFYAGEVDYTKLKMSQGSLGGILITGLLEWSINKKQIVLGISSVDSPFNLPTDQVVAVVWSHTKQKYLSTGVVENTRNNTVLQVNFSEAVENGELIYVYLSAVRADKKYVSDSIVNSFTYNA